MEIVGRGFLAQSLRPLAGSYPEAVVLAAGVSCAADTSVAEFARESDLVSSVATRCAADGRRLVFFSTGSTGMYGAVGCRGQEDEPVAPPTPYGRHKHQLERLVAASGADHVILRLGHVVGPAQPPHQLLPSLIRQVRTGQVRLYRGACRDLVDVADVVTIIDRVLAAGLSRDIVNVASGEAVPVERIVEHLEDRLGIRCTREFVDVPGNSVISTDKLRRLVPVVDTMGFSPDYFRAVVDRHFPLAAAA